MAESQDDEPALPSQHVRRMKRLAQGQLGAIVARFLAYASVLLFGIAVARLEGTTDAGQFFSVLAISQTAAIVGLWGGEKVLLQIFSLRTADHVSPTQRRLFQDHRLKSMPAICVAAFGASLASIYWVDSWLRCGLVALLSIAQALILYHANALRGIGRTIASLFLEGGAGFGAAMAFYLSSHALALTGSFGPLESLASGFALSALTSGLRIRQALSNLHVPTAETGETSIDTSGGLPFVLTTLSNKAATTLAPILLGVVGSLSTVALFSIASRVSNVAAMVAFATQSWAAPRLGRKIARGDLAGARALSRRNTVVTATVTAVGLIPVATHPIVLVTLFGSPYGQAFASLAVLAWSRLAIIAFGPVGQLLMLARSQTINMWAGVGSTALLLVLGTWMGAMWGALGMAVAVSSCLVLRAAVMAYGVRRQLGFWPTIFAPSTATRV